MRTMAMIMGTSLLAALAACGKSREAASENAAERATEKAIESALEKDGTKARVDLSSGGVRMTTTDASGKTSQLEMGSAKVTESDVGVPFYPGAKVPEGQSSRIATPDGTTVSIGLRSGDAPAKVADFYREKLKALAEGKQLTDMSGADGAVMLALADDKSSSVIQVMVTKGESDTDIQIVAQRRAAK